MAARLRTLVVLIAASSVGIASCDKKKSPAEPTPVCSIAISPASLTFGGDGGPGSVTVTAPAGCAWSATTSGAWSAVTAGATGSGAGTVAYTVSANPATESRSGGLTIGGQNHAVMQQGRAATICRYDV